MSGQMIHNLYWSHAERGHVERPGAPICPCDRALRWVAQLPANRGKRAHAL